MKKCLGSKFFCMC